MPPPTVSAQDLAATAPNPVRQALQASVDRFTSRVETTLNHDAMSIARGKPAVREGDPLTAAQLTELQTAAQDFVKDVPIGAFAPEVAADIQAQLTASGLSARDLSSTRLGDLGGVGGDIAKGLLKTLKADSPTAYYSLAGTAATLIGYTAWNDGSAKLSRLGVTPQLTQRFFDDHLELKLKGDWKAHFKDFSTSATVTGRVDLGAGTLSASVSANSKTGLEHARVDYGLSGDHWNLSTTATVNRAGLESVGGTAQWAPSDALKLSATLDHNVQTNRTTGALEGTYQVNRQVDLALSASHDSAGDSRVGVGLRVRF